MTTQHQHTSNSQRLLRLFLRLQHASTQTPHLTSRTLLAKVYARYVKELHRLRKAGG